MASNLRDRGYSSSMDGYQPKRTERPRSRQKTVAPGTASVSRGEKATKNPVRDSAVLRLPSPEQIMSTPRYGSVPEYPPVYQSQQKTPLQLQYTDVDDEADHYNNVERPYQQYAAERDAAAGNQIPLSEIKRRMAEIEQALSHNYTKQAQDRQRRRGYKRSSDPSTLEEELTAAKTVSDYNWEMHDFLDDWMPDLTDDPVALASEQMEHAKAAAAGRVNNAKLNTQNRFDAGYNRLTQDIISDEASIDQLYREYNDLKNEYNARLAQYLQGLR